MSTLANSNFNILCTKHLISRSFLEYVYFTFEQTVKENSAMLLNMITAL